MTYADNDAFMDAHRAFTPTTSEIQDWKIVTAFDAADLVVTKAGLFGANLDSFNEDCITAGPGICKPSDYADYSGWAIGVNWQPDQTTPPTNGDVNGLAFNGLLQYVEVTWVSTASTPYTIESGSLNKEASATVPTDGTDVTLAAANNGFTGWSGTEVTDDTMKTAQTLFRFQKTGDSPYYEIEDTVDVWATQGSSTTPTANVETADFVLVSAVSLTVAVSSVILTSLLL